MEIREIKKLLIGNDKIMQAIEEIISLTEQLSSGLYNNAIIIKSRIIDCQFRSSININVDSETIQIKLDMARFLDLIEGYTDNKGEFIASTTETLVMDNSLPFVDRIVFRNMLRDLLLSNEAKMFFVKGDPKSGMSYLEKYLIHLGKKNKLYQIIPVQIPNYLDDSNPCKGVRLGKCLSELIGLHLDLNDAEEDQFKFIRFSTKLKETLLAQNKIPIIFLHDFHKMAVIPDDLIKFIFNIALTIRIDFPKSVFIIAGLDYEKLPNWHTELKHFFRVYTVEDVDEESIRECLGCIFDEYSAKVFKLGNSSITKEAYVEGLMERLVPDKSKIDLSSVGESIANLLNKLKND